MACMIEHQQTFANIMRAIADGFNAINLGMDEYCDSDAQYVATPVAHALNF